MSSRIRHVAVIGGGIGGLCLAQGLRRAGLTVTVYERDRSADSRLQGFRLHLESTGSTALHACLPPALWEVLVATAGDPGPGISFRDEQMRPLVRIGQKSHNGRKPDPLDPTTGRHAVSRVTLRRLLLAGLDDVVQFGKECTGFAQEDDGTVTAEFADGTTATADVLVAADGAGSRVWGQLHPEADRTTLPATAMAGKLFLTEENRRWLPEELLTGMNAFWPRQDFLFTAVFRRRENPAAINARLGDRVRALGLEPERLLADSQDDDYLLWAFIAHRDALPGFTAQAQADPAAVRALLARRTAGWHPDLRRLLADSTPDTLYQTEFRAARRLRPWRTSNVTGLGDAVHQMPPVGGLGGNTALRDAHRLCAALIAADRGELPLSRTLHDYEADMLHHGFDTVREVVRNTDAAIDRNPLRRAMTRWFFRTCGAVPPLGRAVLGER
ncbi:2-polyprenyl-6-methoxyphenol hydroxylase-like FAD-dependent oxidoreductase [Nonomuraea fuscirosea]|uniref:2-polyprenyl-6-methoxyphenol hydroxylase-like FAD-dependent oxidoreductase n=1 Tax=Nonomuraea fuscirosea TaxID=1291556 RepID=A0A2T0MXA7_9ACTN|nr:FAD-dependent monooxygenase [Nonomuraea fuscirosea]PRX63738.1 2-polyprenyl-6-methoxyphenol hydroxylase-like FAD-dependent oxidoreductase [Nonomuraea fuscirosea]